MSRSQNKVWGWTDNQTNRRKFEKRFANKKVRRTKKIQDGGSFKKVYCSYNICDYKFLYFYKRKAIEEARLFDKKPYKYYQK